MKKKIKLLIITHTFPTKHNPVAAIFLLNQLEELKKHCDIRIIFPYAYVPRIKILNPYFRFSDVPEQETVKGMKVYHPKYFMIPRFSSRRTFINFFLFIEAFFSYIVSWKLSGRLIEEWNPDIIHLHGPLSESLLGIISKKKYNKPLLVTTYGEDITLHSKHFPSGFLIKYTLKNADAIICQSRFLEAEIRNLGITNKFFIIPMGAATKKFKVRDKIKARRMLNLPQNKKIILFVGHLVPRKGVKYLIKACKGLSEKNEPFLCCIIGKGVDEVYLKRLAAELSLNDYVKFLGQKNHEDVARYINSCDLVVLPSLNEGLPVILCESLACGKPVVATGVAGTPELVTKDVGYLVKARSVDDLKDKIIMAFNRKWNAKKLLARANEFSVPVSAGKLLKVYRNIISGKI